MSFVPGLLYSWQNSPQSSFLDARTAPTNAPSRIYGLQIKKGIDVAQYWAKNL
jgi:hypothetical protein